jgi:hypothetical protein
MIHETRISQPSLHQSHVVLNYVRELTSAVQDFPPDQKLDELVRDLAKGMPIVNPQTASHKLRTMIDEAVHAVDWDAGSAAGSAFSLLIIPVAIMTLVIQTIDNIIVQPLCFAKTVDMHPLTVIIELIVGN